MSSQQQDTGASSTTGYPLSGVRVVDLTRVMTGPYCTMMLGDMGADVIKVELPGKGDDTRVWGPPFQDGESTYFLSVNRSKRSVALDLKSDSGREALWRLINSAGVLVENFSPGTAGRLGFGYESVRVRNPGIVYASISGFGQAGPSANRTAYDLIVQGMSGMMSITGDPAGMPTKVGVPVADITAGMFAAYSVAAALFDRQRSGEGRHIDVSMLGSQVALLTYQAGIYFATGETPVALGNAHPIVAPYDTFETADGYVNIAVGNDSLWQRFCRAFDLEDAGCDERFQSNAGRITNKTALYEAVDRAVGSRPTEEVVAALDACGVPCGPIYDVQQMFSDPQADAAKLQQPAPHATLGSISQTGFPYHLSGQDLEIRHGPPTLGQHTQEVLREIGYSEQEIEDLIGSGAAQ